MKGLFYKYAYAESVIIPESILVQTNKQRRVSDIQTTKKAKQSLSAYFLPSTAPMRDQDIEAPDSSLLNTGNLASHIDEK